MKTAAATFVSISLAEMETVIKRGFHALHPKKQAIRGEVVFDMFLSNNAGVRVWTSIGAGGDTGAGLGEDAIRVQLYSFAKGKPLKPGKAPIVKRTQGWKDNLRERIEDAVEDYESKEEDIEASRFVDWSR